MRASRDLASLAAAAIQAVERAYAPYSKFHVGAAVLGDDGRIYAGANVENCSYGLTICAERVAAAGAIVAGARRILAVAIATGQGEPAPPCGACRQFLAEFGASMRVLLCGPGGRVSRRTSLDKLLPGAFLPERLGRRSTGSRPARRRVGRRHPRQA